MPTYNKLVRDKIPEIIAANGERCTYKTLDDAAYKNELRRKLLEEVNEYLEATTDKDAAEELADITEMIHALAELHGKSFADVEVIRQKKRAERGGFKEKLFLIDAD